MISNTVGFNKKKYGLPQAAVSAGTKRRAVFFFFGAKGQCCQIFYAQLRKYADISGIPPAQKRSSGRIPGKFRGNSGSG